MLGVGCGCERDGARGDGPDADASEARDACREDGDESEHVSCPLGRDAHGGGGNSLCAPIRGRQLVRVLSLLWAGVEAFWPLKSA